MRNTIILYERYEGIFPEGPLEIHKCVLYSDHALKRFFENVSQQPWFDNTLFVLTPDHTNQSHYAVYKTDAARSAAPIPSASRALPGIIERSAGPGHTRSVVREDGDLFSFVAKRSFLPGSAQHIHAVLIVMKFADDNSWLSFVLSWSEALVQAID